MAAATPYGFLCVADLAKYCNEEELVQLFHAFGPTVSVKIIQRTENSSTGLVTLPSFKAAEAAKLRLDGCVFMGRKIRISWANTAIPPTAPQSNNVINSIYIRYNARKLDRLIRVEDLERIFAPFGFMTEVCIKDSHMDHRTRRQSGLAFVHFCSSKEGMHAAFRTVSGIDGNAVEGIAFRAELSRNLLRQFDQSRMLSPSESVAAPPPGAFPPYGAPASSMSNAANMGWTGAFAGSGLHQSAYYPPRAPAPEPLLQRAHGQVARGPQAQYGPRATHAHPSAAGHGQPEYPSHRAHEQHHQQQFQHLFPCGASSADMPALGGLGSGQQTHRPPFAHALEATGPSAMHGGFHRQVSLQLGDDASSQLLPFPPSLPSFDESAASVASSSLSLSSAFDLPLSSNSFSSSSGSFRVDGRSKQILGGLLRGGGGGGDDDSWSLRDESNEPCADQSSWDAILLATPEPPLSAGFAFF